jgi:hypothetical protein
MQCGRQFTGLSGHADAMGNGRTNARPHIESGMKRLLRLGHGADHPDNTLTSFD